MARVCQVTGKRPLAGQNVSHANNKTKRRFIPNLQKRRIWVASEERYVTLRLSCHGLRILEKRGVDVILKELRDKGEKV